MGQPLRFKPYVAGEFAWNRGEIARRIFRTCRELGIATVAVFSDPDRRDPHVRMADEAVRLPGSSPAETYLDVQRILDAAKRDVCSDVRSCSVSSASRRTRVWALASRTISSSARQRSYTSRSVRLPG